MILDLKEIQFYSLIEFDHFYYYIYFNSTFSNLGSSPYIYIYIFFFFPNSDYLGTSLVVQPLNKENYNTWNRSVIVALGCKNQDWFLLMVLFQSHNHHLILIMFLGVSAIVWFYLGCSIHFQGKFKLVWSTCKRSLGWFVAHMYSQGNGPRIFELRKQWVRNALRLFY